MREIVVGVDASDASMDAARFAGGLAAKAGSAVTVVHVRQARTPRAVERRIQDRSVAALEGWAVSWTFEIHDGDPARRLQRVARERNADLIVVGACRRSRMDRLGSVSSWLVHHADRPVLIVHDRACELREVVVGVDAGDRGAEPVLFAGRLARDTGAHLTVVYVRHVPAGYLGPPVVGTAQLEAYFDRVAARLRSQVGRALAEAGVAWDFDAGARGDPAKELDRLAEEAGADVVVVGSRGHSALGRALAGSVSTALARHAHRAVLVVR